jgi:hypothetical protein
MAGRSRALQIPVPIERQAAEVRAVRDHVCAMETSSTTVVLAQRIRRVG